MPIQTVLPHDAWAYVRVHRRIGTDKVLSADEIRAWADRLAVLAPQLHGPVFFLWGTDHEDQPIRNMASLAKAASALMAAWPARGSDSGSQRSVASFFKQSAGDASLPPAGPGRAPPAGAAAATPPQSSATSATRPSASTPPSPQKRTAPEPSDGIAKFFKRQP